MRGPDDRVEHDFAKILVTPIPVEVSAGETEAASATFAFGGPGHVLNFAVGDRFANIGVAAVRTVAATHRFFGRMSRQESA